MRYLDLTLATAEENLALDEALLEEAEATEESAADESTEVLRVWESSTPAVVLGRSSRIDQEARRELCVRRGIPMLRRASGGASVVIGPGCLMYAVVLSTERRPALASLDEAHRFVLERVGAAARAAASGVEVQGTSDLTWDGRKFSGNSLRCKRRHLLYHGTLLYNFDLDLLADLLGEPPRQPDYRARRGHRDFVTNLPTTAERLKVGLRAAWSADRPLADWPRRRVVELVAERYSQASWNERL